MLATQNTIPKEWQRVKLGDIANITNGKTNTQDAVVNGEYPLFDRSVLIKRSSKYLFDKTAIIIPGEGSDFVPRYYSGKFDLHQRAYAIFPNEGIFPFFLFQYLYAKKDSFVQKSVGSTVRSLRLPIIQSIDILLPPLAEQKKIAEILSTVDLEIEKTDKIILKVEKLKKGLSQKFFNNKNYKSESIYKIAEVLTGGTPKTSNKLYWGGDIKWMSSGEVNIKKIKDTEKKITKEGLDNSNACILPIGAVMVALAGQGKTRGKVAILETETTCNQSLAAIVADKKYLLDEFLYYNLDYRYRELRNINGEGRAGLNLTIIKNIKIPVPKIEEQKYIVNQLSSLDERANFNMKYKNALKILKKGLMQDLLSGKVRTK